MGKTVQAAGLAAIVAAMVLVPRTGLAGGPPRVVVSLDNQARVHAEAVRAAQEIATQIFAAAGVDLVWSERGAKPAPAALHLSVLLSSRTGEERIIRGRRVNRAVLGLSPRDSRRVYIFTSRIIRLGAADARRFETILGRALAHEIGHHLLPEGHSTSGIMRPKLDFLSLTVPAFSEDEGRYMRALLAVGQPPVYPSNALTRLDADVLPEIAQ